MCLQDPDELAENPTNKNRSRIKTCLFAFSLMVILCLLAILPTLYFCLRSPDVMARFIPMIETTVKNETGMEIHIESLSIDLLNHISLKNLKIDSIPGVESEYIELKSLKINFRPVDLFSEIKRLSSIELNGINAKLHLEEHQSENDSLIQNSHEQQKTFNLQDALNQFPVSAVIDRFQVQNLSIDLELFSPTSKTHLSVNDANFSGEIEVGPGEASISFQSDVSNEKNILTYWEKTKDTLSTETNLSAIFKFNTQAKLKVISDQGLQIYIDPIRSDIKLEKTRFAQKNSMQHTIEFFADYLSSDLLVSVKSEPSIQITIEEGASWIHQIFPARFLVDQKIMAKDVRVEKNDGETKITSDLKSLLIESKSSGHQNGLSAMLKQMVASFSGNTILDEWKIEIEDKNRTQYFSGKKLLVLVEINNEQGEISGLQTIEGQGLVLPGLNRLIDPKLILKQVVNEQSQRLNFDVHPVPDSPEALGFEVTLSGIQSLSPKAGGRLRIRLPEEFLEIHPEITQIADSLGNHADIDAEFEVEANLKGTLSGENGISRKNIKWLTGFLRQTLSVGSSKQHLNSEKSLIRTGELTSDTQFKWSGQVMSADTVVRSPSVWLRDLGTMKGLDSHISVQGNSGTNPNELRMNVRGSLDSLQSHSLVSLPMLPTGLTETLKFLGSFSLKDQDIFRIHQLSVQAGSKNMLTLDTDVSGTLSSKSFLSRGKLKLKELAADGLKVTGQSGLAWDVTVKDGQDFNLKPVIFFDQFSLAGNNFNLANMTGEFRIFESFRLSPEKQVIPDHLIQVDPFRRVDVKKIDPFIEKQHLITVESIRAGSFLIGPLRASGTIEQNTLNIPGFEVKLFGGYGAGEMYLDFHPEHMKFSLKGMLTGIDPEKMVDHASVKKPLKNSVESLIDAHLALHVDLRQYLAEGQVNITKIGRTQLFSLLDLADPNDENEQISVLRSALSLSSPTLVIMNFYQGLMDLDVHLDGLGGRIRVREVPVSSLINRYGDTINQMLLKIPMS